MSAPDTQAWVPASLAAALRVGARVRVRLSGECEATFPARARYCGHEIDGHGHEMAVHMATGSIIQTVSSDNDHDFRVELDVPIPIMTSCECGRPLAMGTVRLAAVELEPLPDEAVLS